jgi:hypothetical protein
MRGAGPLSSRPLFLSFSLANFLVFTLRTKICQKTGYGSGFVRKPDRILEVVIKPDKKAELVRKPDRNKKAESLPRLLEDPPFM